MCAGQLHLCWLLSSAVGSFLLPLTGWSEDSVEGRDPVKGSQIPESGGQKGLLDQESLIKNKIICVCVYVCVKSLGFWSLNINLQTGLTQKSMKRLLDYLTRSLELIYSRIDDKQS